MKDDKDILFGKDNSNYVFRLDKIRCLKVLKQNKEGIFVNMTPKFKGFVEIDNKIHEIKLYPAYKPGGPGGVIPKNPNKFYMEIGGDYE